MNDEYYMAMDTAREQNVRTRDDFIHCPNCKSLQLSMGKVSMPNKIHGRDGVVIEFTCKECSSELSLGLFNDDIGLPELNARINWVEKPVYHVRTSTDKLSESSLIGQSEQFRKYIEKYNLHDLKVGDKLPEGVPYFKSEDYEDDNVINIKDKKNPQ
tara:strand:- start:321 stop:791 length:471 start_codon:yes stop_codon:yes gene_type:complete